MPNSRIPLPEKDTDAVKSELMRRSMLDSGCPEPHECFDRKGQEKKEKRGDEEEEDKDARKRRKDDGSKWEESSFEIQVKFLGEKSMKMDEVFRRRGKLNVGGEAKANGTITKCCPAAPRKPKSMKRNRRCWFRRSVLLDVSKEVESMFPPHILQDFGKKIEKARS